MPGRATPRKAQPSAIISSACPCAAAPDEVPRQTCEHRGEQRCEQRVDDRTMNTAGVGGRVNFTPSPSTVEVELLDVVALQVPGEEFYPTAVVQAERDQGLHREVDREVRQR
jgi:hypothetical protein